MAPLQLDRYAEVGSFLAATGDFLVRARQSTT